MVGLWDVVQGMALGWLFVFVNLFLFIYTFNKRMKKQAEAGAALAAKLGVVACEHTD